LFFVYHVVELILLDAEFIDQAPGPPASRINLLVSRRLVCTRRCGCGTETQQATIIRLPQQSC